MDRTFRVGEVVRSVKITRESDENSQIDEAVTDAIRRYMLRDWGDTSPEGCARNDEAAKAGTGEIIAKYQIPGGIIFIRTDETRDYTVVMSAAEYY